MVCFLTQQTLSFLNMEIGLKRKVRVLSEATMESSTESIDGRNGLEIPILMLAASPNLRLPHQ